MPQPTKMSKKSRVEIIGYEFESDDLEYLMKHKANKSIIEKEEDTLLPEEIISDEILVKLPAQYLYQELRLICKTWKNIISCNNFILENFSKMKPTFLVQSDSMLKRRFYHMEINEKQLSYKMPELGFSCLGKPRSSCHGMVLIESWERWNVSVLQVMNLVTKCCLTLPKCLSGCPHQDCGSALGFDPCTNLFKVVHMYAADKFEIFTIGDASNAWKKIPGPENLLISEWSDPVSINGRFLYWDVGSFRYILSMDVSDEKCIKLKLPYQIFADDSIYYLVELGGHLSFIHFVASNQMDIWILQDFHSKLWFKKQSVHARMIKSSINPLPSFTQLIPVGGTSNGVLVFTHSKKRMYIFDMVKKTMKKYITKADITKLIVHRSSLFKLQQ